MIRVLRAEALEDGRDQRRHDRYVIEMPGVLRLDGARGVFLVTVLDLSKSGLRFRSSRTFPAGARVEVKCGDKRIFGVVRYAREVGHEFNVGVEADRVEAPNGAVVAGDDLDLTAIFPIESKRPRAS